MMGYPRNDRRLKKGKLLMHLSRRSSFTLLEIIIVVIIISVLASLAIPRIGPMVEQSRGTEALNVISMIRGAMEKCYVAPRSYSNCKSTGAAGWGALGMTDPSNSINSHFDYQAIGILGFYEIVAYRNTYELVADQLSFMGMGDCGTLSGVLISGKSMIHFCSDDGRIRGTGFYSGF